MFDQEKRHGRTVPAADDPHRADTRCADDLRIWVGLLPLALPSARSAAIYWARNFDVHLHDNGNISRDEQRQAAGVAARGHTAPTKTIFRHTEKKTKKRA